MNPANLNLFPDSAHLGDFAQPSLIQNRDSLWSKEPSQTKPTPKALSISEINEQAKKLLERSFSDIYIEGEVSKMSAAASYKHWYFTLKDEQSKIDCAYFNPPSGQIQPQVGQKIILKGRLSLYAKDARYQFIASRIIATDERGMMYEIYLKLYEKLKNAGVFDNKRPLASSFKSVGIITSASSAAMADILRIRAELGDLCTKISIYDSLVQGPGAANTLLKALQTADSARHDVLLLTRGGGSKEDLFCFNDEALCLAIAKSKTPVITAIGHEIDQHLADFAADLSLPTPSAAARRVFFDLNARLQEIDLFTQRVESAKSSYLQKKQKDLELIKLKLVKNPFKEYITKLQNYQKIIEIQAKNALQNRAKTLKNYQSDALIAASLDRKRSQINLLEKSIKLNTINMRLTSCQRDLEAKQTQIAMKLSANMQSKLAKMQHIKGVLTAHEGFLKTMRKCFKISHIGKENEALESLDSLAAGDEIAIQDLMANSRTRHAKLLD